MTSSPFTCTWLLLSCCIFFTLSTSELEFYQDAVPETSDDVGLRDIARYLETHFNPFRTSQGRKKHHLEVNRQKERDLLDTLDDKTSLDDILRKGKLDEWNYHRRMQYNDPVNEIPREREYELPYYDVNPLGRAFDYSNLKLPYFTHKPNKENVNFKNNENLEYRPEISPVKELPYERVDFEKGMKEEPTFESHGNYVGLDRNLPGNEGKLENVPAMPKFTFKFDNANLREEHPFAVKPNDPRYYQDAPFSLGERDTVKHDKVSKNYTKWEKTKIPANEEYVSREYEETTESTKYHKTKDTSMVTLPEPNRRTGENHPLVVPVNRDLNNDIYFIAIVAGCSAAAMFALVLISLTWCRLQRGVKAAADIEYPAYGVTGPNKDVSPSGDQRLAQSAQMYHFQHQKQQIIAMENRTSATRDPGSVSEAESDEENEEGDYTVYECPGLASTGEMEVKNPLFHDDPTPATPAQTNKEEDHI